MTALLDLACETVSSAPGTGTTISLSGTVVSGGYLKWTDAGAVDQVVYRITIVDGTSRELATATYNASGNQFTNRTTLIASVAGVKQTTPINASANCIVGATVAAEDLGSGTGANVALHALYGGI